MPFDTVLLWLALLSSVVLLVRGAGALWSAKAWLILLTGGLGVLYAPLQAGWVAGALWAGLVLLPMLLARLANHTLLAQRYAITLALYGAVVLLHPDAAFRAQVGLVRAQAQAARGRFEAAIARLDRLARRTRTPPGTALLAKFHGRRLEGRLDLLLTEVAWGQDPSPLSAMVRLGALATLGRSHDLVAAQAEHAESLRSPAARDSRIWAFALVSLFVGTGRVAPLRRLFAGPLRSLPAETRRYQLALANLAAGTDTEAVRDALSHLATDRNRDLGLRAARSLAAPPAPVALTPSEAQIVDAAAADLDAALALAAVRPRISRSPVTLGLLAINLAAFGAELALGGSEDPQVLDRLGALWPSLVLHGQWWRVPASTFLHLGWTHLGVNMVALAVLGRDVERTMGRWRMLATYLASGFGAASGIVLLTRLGWIAQEWVVGASGAIMGLLGALVVDAARSWRRTGSRGARLRVGSLLALVAIQAALDVATPEISVSGHVLGLLLGVLAASLLGRAPTAAVTPLPAGTPPQAGPLTAPMTPRRLVLASAGATIALAAAVALPSRRQEAAAKAARDAATSISRHELAGIRALRFVFVDGVEAGAPAVDAFRPFGSPDPLADLAAVTGTAGDAALRTLYARVMRRVPVFCANAQLPPGSYVVDGAQIQVTAEQLSLVAALAWDTEDLDGAILPQAGAWPVAAVDVKRPYGDMSFFEADMAEAIGLPVGHDPQGQAQLPDAVIARLDALHRSMATVLRAFVSHAALT